MTEVESNMTSRDLSPDRGKQIAIEAYRKNMPVIVRSAAGDLLHGAEDLRNIVDTQAPLTCTIIRLDISVDDWNASEWPEIFEAARHLWLSEKLP
jgi:hypothetical protein